MTLCYYDTETTGLAGPAVIIQYAFDDGPIEIHDIWNVPASETMALIERMMECDIVGFNLSFDQFQLNKLYNMLLRLTDRYGDVEPRDYIDELAELEPLARDGLCIKPKSACDIMCHARKTKYQSTMDRKSIWIRRVPVQLASRLAELLEEKIKMSDIYFARRKDKYAPKWKVMDIKDVNNFKHVVLNFKASSSLKALAIDALKLTDIMHFSDVSVPKAMMPLETLWAPFALSFTNKALGWEGKVKVGKKEVFGKAWPAVMNYHIRHWTYNERARKYARLDVHYTRELYKYFDSPEPGDDDSELACCVAAVRWKGYSINISKLERQRELAIKKAASVPTAPKQTKAYIHETLSETERVVLGGSTKKVILEEIAKWDSQDCFCCKGKGCVVCDNSGRITHPASRRAKAVLDARTALKEVELYNKLLMAGRFHASFNVIGTLSSRMSGADKLNPQGVKKTKEVRSCFTFTFGADDLCGGDFSGFEVVLADAVYNDPDLRKALLTCAKCGGQMITLSGPPKCPCGSTSGKKIHALFGVHVYPGMTYDQIVATDGTADDKYTRCKSAVFAMLYGGEGYTLKTRLGVDQETADAAYQKFVSTYKRVGLERRKVFDMFCSMRQPGGVGSRVEWHEPSDYIESITGFRRYFTLENLICRSLFEIANNIPKEWTKIRIKVQRRDDRIQTVSGAVSSALYGAAFGIQSSNMRAAANHVIQSSGAVITKRVQRRIWDLQPSGVSGWVVQPCNVHDEILTPTRPDYVDKVNNAVNETVESFRPTVPLIVMKWKKKLSTWADK